MSYRYEDHREWLGSDEGTKAVGEVLRKVDEVLRPAGAAMMCNLWPSASDSWKCLAAVDHACAMGVIREVEQARTPAGQHRVFVLRGGRA